MKGSEIYWVYLVQTDQIELWEILLGFVFGLVLFLLVSFRGD